MGVKIGNHTKIGNYNAIGDNASVRVNSKVSKEQSEKKNWFIKHPFLASIIASIIAGIILLFSFWSNIVKAIEALFVKR
ncbi:MAG TPA: hypothetical protein VF941_02620 [Clostridia bacterium]